MEIIRKYLEDNNIQIEEIQLLKKEGKLVFLVSSKQVLLYEELHRIEDECMKRNPHLKKVNIMASYKGSMDISRQMKSYYPNIEYMLSKHCPASGKIQDCFQVKVEEEANSVGIVIDVHDKIIQKNMVRRKIDQQIRHSIGTSLGLDAKIHLRDQSQMLDLNSYMQEGEKHLEQKIKENYQAEKPKAASSDTKIIKGKAIRGETRSILEWGDLAKKAIFEGEVYAAEERKLNNKKILQSFVISDNSSSIMCKVFWEPDEEMVKNGAYLRVCGDIMLDSYTREITATLKDINLGEKTKRKDLAPHKRVELHLHSKMSSMDGVESVKTLIKRAAEFGHQAVAITDHGVVQAFPDAMDQGAKSKIKVIYGVEGYLVDDTKRVLKEYNHQDLNQEFVVFDIETTGLSATEDRITEIGAVKIVNGVITEHFSQLVNPERKLSSKIIELTGITDDMLKGQPAIDEVLPRFMAFCKNSMFVAHNSDFDTGFIRQNCNKLGIDYALMAIDTVAVSRALLTDLKSHRLNTVAKRLGISLENHHRAVDDAQATAEIFLKFLEMFREEGVETLNQVNEKFVDKDYKSKRPNHAIILVKNLIGLKNLYKIISDSHIHHFYKVPRILKSVLNSHREGLLLGSACESGEVYQGVLKNLPDKELKEIVQYYDYLEIMPCANNEFMLRKGIVGSQKDLQQINQRILNLGEKHHKLVVATGDVHYLEKEDAVIRDVFKAAQKFSKDLDNGSLYFRTTDEMLEEFAYLGKEIAQKIVVENPNKIADSIEEFKPIPDGTFPPIIEGSDVELREMCLEKARQIYGDPIPDIVLNRLNRELDSIIGNGYAVMYIIAQKLVKKSVEDGYLVGSRGSVGSSFAATMSDITEVNPLPPHYICPSCKFSEFVTDGSVGSGMDLPDKICPKCSTELIKEGHDIPFEVFLGFKGDKEPDIDLNFAGEYQPRAHKYTEELFGKDYVFRAGTIGTVADKTAYGYVMKYAEDYDIKVNNAHALVLRDKCTGVKRTTGQHPGGVMVVPNYKDIYDFTPIQHPANDGKMGILTTHFAYESISGRILKLDILGHDVPSIIRMLEDFTGVRAVDVKLDDRDTMKLFTSAAPLKCSLKEINCETGTLGIPEFGTKFVRQMLMDTRPTTFAELLRISGLSHGTDVWINNAQELIKKDIVTLKDVISTRDDIMNYLIFKGLQPLMAFKIMENVRKGKGLTDEHIQAMAENQVPPWYVESCQKIKYMFPKAHAAAYVMMSFRIAYFKVHHKEAFYAAFFTTKAEDFDVAIISKGKEKVLQNIKSIEAKGNEASVKEKGLQIVLESAYEMYQRGVELLPVDIYHSDPVRFLIQESKLLPPLISIPGLGETVAQKIKEESAKEFISIEDFRKRTKASKTVIETLVDHGCLSGLPESNQLSMF